MRHPPLLSCLYCSLIIVSCGYIGVSAPAVANVVVDAEINTRGASLGLEPAIPRNIVPVKARSSYSTYRQVGIASWYGNFHQGRRTASGEKFDQNQLTAAHRSLPLDTIAHVTNLANGRSVDVRVNDRGPFVHGRVIDLSARAARLLGMTERGLALVRIEVLRSAGNEGPTSNQRLAWNAPP